MARPHNYDQLRNASKPLVDGGLTLKVLMVLRDDQNRNLELKFKGQEFNYALLCKVADEIYSGKVMVCFDSLGTRSFTAKYLEGYDILLMDFQDTSNLYGRGAIIHEATHIINDRRGKKVRDLYNEEAAFIYQAMYYRLSGMREQNFPGAINNLFPAAFAIADHILKKQASLLSEDLAMEREIMSMPEYKNQINSPNKMRAYDGIPSK